MLVVSLCKPVIHKLKILGGRKLEYYKSIGGTTKREGDQTEMKLLKSLCWVSVVDSEFILFKLGFLDIATYILAGHLILKFSHISQ